MMSVSAFFSLAVAFLMSLRYYGPYGESVDCVETGSCTIKPWSTFSQSQHLESRVLERLRRTIGIFGRNLAGLRLTGNSGCSQVV